MIGYSMFYFVRKNFAFAMPAIGEEYGITNTDFGIILTIAGIVYGVSKFINGIIADRTNARWHLAIGLGLCVILNYAFGWSASVSSAITGQEGGPDFVNALIFIMAVLLVMNNVFQGCGFAPCNHLLAHWVPPRELATKTAIWNTSHSIGAGLVSVMCGYIIASTGDWRQCFWIPSVIAALGVLFIIATLRDTPESVGLPEIEGTETELDEHDNALAFRMFIRKKVFGNPVIWILALSDFFVYIVRFAVLDWGPTFLQDRNVPLSAELAGWTIAIFEIAGCAGMVCAGWVSDRVFGGKTQRMCAVEMLLVAVCMCFLHFLPESADPIVVLVLLSITGFFLYGPQALLGVAAVKQATKKAASSAVGLLGFMSYLSVVVTGAGLGLFSDKFGWENLFILMACFALIGASLAAVLWNIPDDGYKR